MIKLNTTIVPMSELHLLSYLLFSAIVLLSFLIFAIKAGSILEGRYNSKKSKRIDIIVALFCLVMAVLAIVFMVKIDSERKEANEIALTETVERNIEFLLIENQQKEQQLNSLEIKTYITFNIDYFLTKNVQGLYTPRKEALENIENLIKKYVFNHYDRDSLLYQELIIESKPIFNES